MEAIVQGLKKALQPAGILIVHPFRAQSYNAQRKATLPALLDFGRDNTLAVLVGTTKHVWGPFTAHVRGEKWLQGPDLGRREHPHPFDEFCSERLAHALSSAANGCAFEVRHTFSTGDKFVDLLCAIEAAGFGARHPTAYLAVHPELGAWFSIRSIITFDCNGPACPPQLPCDAHGTPWTIPAAAAAAVAAAMPALLAPPTKPWPEWAAMRRALSDWEPARSCEYERSQLLYHYAHDRRALLDVSAAEEQSPSPQLSCLS